MREFLYRQRALLGHEYHMDGLRLDATHAMLDDGAEHILRELSRGSAASLPAGRHFVICAEDDRNDTRLITPAAEGGAGMDAVWADDFHHEIRSALAGDNEGYYADYTGNAATGRHAGQGWFYTGQLIRVHGAQPRHGCQPVRSAPLCLLHPEPRPDRQPGLGERLSTLVGRATYRAVSSLLLLSPYTPLLFQGQEWAAETPFLFFTDHEAELGEQVTTGRRKEFAHFVAFQGPAVPDPQAPSSFEASKLRWDEIDDVQHTQTLDLYRELLALRQSLPAFRDRSRAHWDSTALDDNTVALRYSSPTGQDDLLLVVNRKDGLHVTLAENTLTTPPAGYRWQVILSSDDIRFGGPHSLTDLQMAVDAGGSRRRAPGSRRLPGRPATRPGGVTEPGKSGGGHHAGASTRGNRRDGDAIASPVPLSLWFSAWSSTAGSYRAWSDCCSSASGRGGGRAQCDGLFAGHQAKEDVTHTLQDTLPQLVEPNFSGMPGTTTLVELEGAIWHGAE